MRIIFIRHGDPDYVNDTLTEKGWREAGLLADRVSKWDVKEFYCSPLGRARDTASCTLKRMGREAVIFDWLKEFFYPIDDPTTGRHGVPWDFMPSYWTREPRFYDKDRWHEIPILKANAKIRPAYEEVCKGIDGILAEYGYVRKGMLYRTPSKAGHTPDAAAAVSRTPNLADVGTANLTGSYCEDTIVIFCHLGVTLAMMSHLLGIAPTLLWQNFFVAPTSVTILNSEERMPNEAYFRCQVTGDTTHLHNGGEPLSRAGYFAEPFML